jgi:hypothetical protein
MNEDTGMKRRVIAALMMPAVIIMLGGCASAGGGSSFRALFLPDAGNLRLLSNDDGFWKGADPASLGLNVRVIEAHWRLCEATGADSLLVIYKGLIVSEGYSVRCTVPIHAMSSTKSITSVLAGMLADSGSIPSFDAPVSCFIPSWSTGARARVTIHHLLTHTSGLLSIAGKSVGFEDDKDGYVLGLSPQAEPGTRFQYSNEAVQLLSPVLDAAAGKPIQDYARDNLFGPLGMSRTRLKTDGLGHAWTYADMETTTRDFARIGVLMMHKADRERAVRAGGDDPRRNQFRRGTSLVDPARAPKPERIRGPRLPQHRHVRVPRRRSHCRAHAGAENRLQRPGRIRRVQRAGARAFQEDGQQVAGT